jgi:hypothetical protein
VSLSLSTQRRTHAIAFKTFKGKEEKKKKKKKKKMFFLFFFRSPYHSHSLTLTHTQARRSRRPFAPRRVSLRDARL